MRTYNNFESIYNDRYQLPSEGWIYIQEEDFEDLSKASYFVFEENELSLSDFTETDQDVVPTVLYKQFHSITTLVETYIFMAIYEHMEQENKSFTLEEKIEALYYYLEEDTFLY